MRPAKPCKSLAWAADYWPRSGLGKLSTWAGSRFGRLDGWVARGRRLDDGSVAAAVTTSADRRDDASSRSLRLRTSACVRRDEPTLPATAFGIGCVVRPCPDASRASGSKVSRRGDCELELREEAGTWVEAARTGTRCGRHCIALSSRKGSIVASCCVGLGICSGACPGWGSGGTFGSEG
jgi:hypothetical protein